MQKKKKVQIIGDVSERVENIAEKGKVLIPIMHVFSFSQYIFKSFLCHLRAKVETKLWLGLNSLSNNNNEDHSKLRGLSFQTKKMWFRNWSLLLDKLKTFWEKEKNAGYQHFFSFPSMFSKAFHFSSLILKSRLCRQGLSYKRDMYYCYCTTVTCSSFYHFPNNPVFWKL